MKFFSRTCELVKIFKIFPARRPTQGAIAPEADVPRQQGGQGSITPIGRSRNLLHRCRHAGVVLQKKLWFGFRVGERDDGGDDGDCLGRAGIAEGGESGSGLPS